MTNYIQSLAARIKISILTQSFWNPKKRHIRETYEENRRHSLDNDAEVYIKLTKHDALMAAMSIKGKIYNEHRRLTLPSPQEGVRIIPLGREFEHSSKLSELNNQFNKNVNRFIDDYDEVIEEARHKFNGLFDSSMFPPEEVIKTKFSNNVKYMSCPYDGDWGVWLNETVQLSQFELQDRLVTAARHLIEVCEGDGRLYSSVLENLEDICELTGDFNLLEDPIIAKAAKELAPIAKDYSIETLRDNDGLRKDTARRVSQVLSTLKLA